MAKKSSRKAAKPPNPPTPPKVRRAAQTDATERGPTDPLTDAQKAQVWVLRAEARSLRQIGAEVGCDTRTVGRVLQSDPERHAALAAAQKEERATLWRGVENRSLRVLDDCLGECEEVIRRLRKPGSKVSQNDRDKVAVLRSLMPNLRMSADSATARSQLLTGQPTEISQGIGGVLDPDRMTPEELADMAIQFKMVDQLPPRLRELAEKRGAEQGGVVD